MSVVVPTRDRPDALRRCLTAVTRQRGPDLVEVIVVDDGSVDSGAVSWVAGSFSSVRLVAQGRAGPAAARNRGVHAASAPVICFTDDDCEPAPDWVERLLARLDGRGGAVAGTTVLPRLCAPPAAATQVVTDHLRDWSLTRGTRAPFAPSNNLACTADVLADVPFDERFRVAGGEDRAWCARLAERGLALEREPDAVVVHRPELTLSAFWHQHQRYGRGSYTLRRSGGWRLEPPAFYRGLLGRAFGEGAAVGALVCAAQAATASGFAREALR